MRLKDIVKITPRYQRAIRIDADFSAISAIDGFVCPRSSADALIGMIRHVAETNQGAFTWTGPYGSGKSSLVVALGSLLGGNKQAKLAAEKALGPEVAEEILRALPPQKNGWRLLPVVGRRANPVQVIGDAFWGSTHVSKEQKKLRHEADLVGSLLNVAESDPDTYGGLIVFIDEMGKFLEGAAHENADIYFFQELAEAASRSNKRLIVVGILHQAFGDYANRLSREMRDEWSKIQGRFIDLPINVAGEEQIDLLSRAITKEQVNLADEKLAIKVSKVIRANKRGVSPTIASLLAHCWPLHPAVACLLSSISRRRFGQNQRSLFGFLNSAEPFAFQDFLSRANIAELYTLELLWEYMRTNLESSILASPDGHRWAIAVEAIERAEAQVTQALHLQLLKAIALIDLFKSNTGLVATREMLEACCPQYSLEQVENALDDLKRWSFIIFRGHLDAYAVYAGSDFDIDEASAKAREDIREIDFKILKRLAGLQPILAKRHYHATGALRWFDVELVLLKTVVEEAKSFAPTKGTIGQFLLAIPTENESKEVANRFCADAAQNCPQWDVVVGLSDQSWVINDLSMEILALEKVYNENTDLGGDSVARREVRARMSDLQGQLEAELNRAFDKAYWYRGSDAPEELSRKAISVLASELADNRFPESPKIQNELLNRIKPSSNAVAAQNALLKRMVMHEGEPRLGIEGFPAEGGLFFSILEATKLYDNDHRIFLSPKKHGEDPKNLLPLWNAAADYLKQNSSRTVSVAEIYDIWREPPFGVRDGLMPVLAVAYLLSERSSLAFYREGIFQSRLRDIDIEILSKDPSAIQVRHVELSEVSKKLLSGMADIVRELDPKNALEHLEPIDVGRGLVTIFDKVHPWTKRTMHLSKDAIRIRTLFKKANDPNKFLFDDIPALLETSDLNDIAAITRAIEHVYNGLRELKDAFEGELNRLREIMLAELQVPNLSPQTLSELRERATNIKQLSGDFRLEAFVVRLADFSGTNEDMEGIASLVTSKPPKMWVDNDVDRAKVEITALSQKFIRTEIYARVKGREDKRQSLAVFVGIDGRPTPVHTDFDVLDSDHAQIKALVKKIEKTITEEERGKKNIVLAALAELSARFIEVNTDDQNATGEKAVS